jgi:Zn-finger protein
MKKLILLAITTLMMVGCRYKSTGVNIIEATNPVIIVDEHTLDSCEYYPGYGHKGNCRFCKDRRQKELKELVEQLKDK